MAIKKGDVIARVSDPGVKTPDAFREWLQMRGPGEPIKLALLRDDRPLEMTVTLTATSRPKTANERRAYLGMELAETRDGDGIPVTQVAADSPAATAGLRKGDLLLKIDGAELNSPSRLNDILTEKAPGDTLAIAVRRDGADMVLRARLIADRTGGGRGGIGGGRAGGTGRGGDGAGRGGPAGGGRGGDGPANLGLWKKDVFRIAIIGVEFPDLKHNPAISMKAWERPS